MKSHKSEVAITFYLYQPGNSVGSPLNQMHWQQLETITNSRPATAGTLGERGRGGDDDDELMLNVLRCHETY